MGWLHKAEWTLLGGLLAAGVLAVVLLERERAVEAGPAHCARVVLDPWGNRFQDVDGDGQINITDAVVILRYLFLGGPPPLTPCNCMLPATGQMRCYDNSQEIECERADFPGQDGFYQAGCPHEDRFVDNGDGTVSDYCTGLMWQKVTAQVSPSSTSATWQGALQFCDALILANYDDWRLPNVSELHSLVDYDRVQPSIPAPFVSVGSLFYWSSSSNPQETSLAISVQFSFSSAETSVIVRRTKTTSLSVRAVRTLGQ
jgi:hypothetical protein